jgi:hypothetical protein
MRLRSPDPVRAGPSRSENGRIIVALPRPGKPMKAIELAADAA